MPADVPVGDLLPTFLHHLGDGLADAGLAHGGWVLQRLGDPPLDEDASVAELGLRDGEMLYVRPRSEQIPPVHFDDLADGVAAGMRGRAGLWRPEMVRWTALGLFATVLAVGLVALVRAGTSLAGVLSAASLTVLCLAGAFGLTRAGGDRAFGIVAAALGIAYATLAAMLAPDLGRQAPALVVGAPEVFAGAVAALVSTLLAAVLVGWAGPFFAGAVAAALFTAIGSGLATFVPQRSAQAAAVVAVATTVVTVVVPMIASRLAGIVPAPLPTQPEHLQENIDPEPSEALLAQAAIADRYMTGLYVGLALATAVAMMVLATLGGWAAWTLIALVAVVRLLALRPMTSAWHRLSLAVPAALGLIDIILSALATAALVFRSVLLVAALPVSCALLFVLARKLPGRRIMPYWGRIGDLLQFAATVALLPVLLALLGAYGAARALGG
ncbi:hypothetical protein GCM10022255_113710 [Dactylosporangium darangshiense]|uniref:EccD-like transmembrane domain-containing protein n=1 Tax=Dactylosporangium darangshiense TaxID=579108 RepID=A0ABP8DVE7_9ACTN